MRHAFRGGFAIARQCVPAQIDTGRQHEAVIGELRTVRQADTPMRRIDRDRGGEDDADAACFDLIIGELLLFERVEG